jgi:hypothetical protein
MDASGQDAKFVDLDFWYNPTYENYFRLLDAMEKLGQDVRGFREEQAPDPKRSFFRLERPKFTLDFLPVIPGLPRFREVFAAKVTTKLGEVEIPFVNYEHLIMNKLALGRAKDQEDIRQLELKKQEQKLPQPRISQRRRS